MMRAGLQDEEGERKRSMPMEKSLPRSSHELGRLANCLGWFSLALGAVELVAPRAIKRWAGAPGPKILLQAYGLREIAAGMLILFSRRPEHMMWTRCAGDLLDVATLIPALRRRNRHRIGGKAAMVFVLAATALDFWAAMGRR